MNVAPNTHRSRAARSRRSFLASALCVVLGASSLAGCSADPAEAAHSILFDRVAVIGASASAGFGLVAETGSEVRLVDVLEAALPDTIGATCDAADLSLFLAPEARLAKKLAEVEAFQPTLVVGIDAMFWFAYGPMPDASRRGRLAEGLALLEGLLERTDAVLALGDLPDVRDANPLFMPPTHRPSNAALAALQADLRAWCDAREDVVLVPLAEFAAVMRRGAPIELLGRAYPGRPLTDYQQNDRLHPTLEGTAAMALLALDRLQRLGPLPSALRSDPADVAAAVRAR